MCKMSVRGQFVFRDIMVPLYLLLVVLVLLRKPDIAVGNGTIHC